MQHIVRCLAIGLLAIGAGACADPSSPATFVTPTDPPTDIGTARDVWSAADVGAYALRIRTACFCDNQDYRIVVDADGTVQQGAPEDYLPETVEDLHAEIQEAYDEDAANVQVTYNMVGVPTNLFIDRSESMADEEIGDKVSFEDLP